MKLKNITAPIDQLIATNIIDEELNKRLRNGLKQKVVSGELTFFSSFKQLTN